MEHLKQLSRNTVSDEVQAQFQLLDTSQRYISVILIGILLQYRALDFQREQLLSSVFCPDAPVPGQGEPEAMRLVASLLVLSSLLGFQNQSETLNAQARAAGRQPDCVEPFLGGIIILIALVRFVRLLQAANQSGATLAAEEAILEDEDL